jgi:hypothetical protein
VSAWATGRRRFDALGPRWQSVLALLLFCALSVAYFGRGVIRDPSGVTSGLPTSDVASFVWAIGWWPHAIAHGTNPFVTHDVFYPSGFNLTWATAIPGVSLIVSPITALFGPVVGYNVAALLAPATAAWVTFLLCRRLTGRFAPSLFGGYVFGFSTYEVGQMLGHLHLTVVVSLPLLAYLVVRFVQGDLSRRALVLFTGLTICFELLVSTEVLLTMTLAAACALVLAYASLPGLRTRLRDAAVAVAGGYAVAAVLLAPFFYYLLVDGVPNTPLEPPGTFSADALNFLLPTLVTRVGANTFFPVTTRFTGNIAENGAYLGLPLVVMLVVWAAPRWRSPAVILLGGGIVIASIAALGPSLHIDGVGTLVLPWRAVVHLPFIKHVLPVRVIVFAWLAAGVAGALWLAEDTRHAWRRWALAALVVASLLPNFGLPVWSGRPADPAFFADNTYRRYLKPGEVALVLPYGVNGVSMLWQAQRGYDFRLASGYFSYVPPEFQKLPIVANTFFNGQTTTSSPAELRTFIRDHDVRAIIVQDGTAGPWATLFGTLGVQPQHVGGVSVYDLHGLTV